VTAAASRRRNERFRAVAAQSSGASRKELFRFGFGKIRTAVGVGDELGRIADVSV
jgi:hypothetical protein